MTGAALVLPLRLSLHGSAVSLQVGTQVTPLERKIAALLAYVHVEGATPRARLAGLLWPEASNDGARGNLRQCLARLRKLSGDVLSESAGLLAIAPTVAVEVPSSPQAKLLAPFDYDDCEEFARWIDGRHQGDLASRRAKLVADVKHAKQRGDLDEAQACADELLSLDRESEDSYRTLMEVAYLRGDFTAAVGIWNRCREMLRRLHGVTPTVATDELGRLILSAANQTQDHRPSVTPPPIPLSVLRPPRLIGRGTELDAMLTGWAAGALVCVCGEAGIGKSRLLAEFATALGTCASAAARPGDSVQPYSSLCRLIAVAFDRFDPPFDGDDARWLTRLLPAMAYLLPDAPAMPLQTDREHGLALQALKRLLVACVQRGCKAVILDDLHYADRSTLEALPSLMSSTQNPALGTVTEGPPLRFAFGSRLDDVDSPSTALLSAWSQDARVTRIDLAPLGDTGVHDLLASLDLPGQRADHVAGRLQAQFGGNPAFLLESLKLMLSLGASYDDVKSIPVAPGIEAVVQRRVALLSPPARHIAQLAAIAGGGFSAGLAAAALACPVFSLAEPMRELELRQVLYGRQFVHDLVASAVERSIPAAVAEFMHRFVADYLEAHDGDPALVADHWQACGEWRRAGLSHMRAASAAGGAVRPREQAEFLDAAAGCFERCGSDHDLFDAVNERLDVESVADRVSVRGRLVARLQTLAGTEVEHVWALLRRVSFASEHAQLRGLQELKDGLRRAQAIDEERLAFEFCEPIATQLALNGNLDEAVTLIGSFVPWAEAQTNPRLRGLLDRTLGAVYGLCDRLSPAIESLQRASAIFQGSGDDLRRLPVLSNIGLFQHWRGELDAARLTLSEASQIRDRLHGSGASLVIEVHLAAVLRDLGEFMDANSRLERLSEQFRAVTHDSEEPPTDLVVVENHQAQLWLMLGQPVRAIDCLRVGDSQTDVRFRSRRLALRLRAAHALGRDVQPLMDAAGPLSRTVTSAFHRALLQAETHRFLPPVESAAAYARLYDEEAVVQRPTLRLQVAIRAAQAELARDDRARALNWIDCTAGALKLCRPFDMDMVEAWSIVSDVLRTNERAAAAEEARQLASALSAQIAAGLSSELRAPYLEHQRRVVDIRHS